MFYKCLTVLGARYTEGRPTSVLLCTALSIFALVTVVRVMSIPQSPYICSTLTLSQHFIMDIMRVVNAFTTQMAVPYSPVFYYAVVRRDLDLIKSGCYVATTIIADGLIVSSVTLYHR